MHRFRHLISAIPVEELRRRLRAADLAILDMDGSLHWGITQGIAALGLVWQVMRRPERLGDRRLLPRLALTGLAVGALRFHYGRFRDERMNRRLIRLWCRGFRGTPMTYFRRAAQGIPGRSFPWVRRTIGGLAERMPVGIVSVGLDTVVHEYVRQYERGGRRLITFHRANRMVIEVRGERMVFAGRYGEPLILSGADKAAVGQQVIEEHRSRRPLVIGNDEGDGPLASLAREAGGLAIGVCPPRRIRRLFDAYLTRRDWSPLAALLA